MTIVIPAYNEQDNIKRIPIELLFFLEKMPITYEVIIINDGSTDNTLNEAKKISIENRNLKIIQHDTNLGLAESLRTAIEHTQGNLVVFLDADFTFHPSEIEKLYEKYIEKNCDCIIGSCFNAGNISVPFYRLVLTKVVNKMYRMLLETKISAITPIFRLYKTSVLKQLKLVSQGFEISAEIFFELIKEKKHLEEIPVKLTTRIYDKSKLQVKKELANHIKILTRIIWWKIKNNAKN